MKEKKKIVYIHQRNTNNNEFCNKCKTKKSM